MEMKILLIMICANLAFKVCCEADDNDFPGRDYLNTSVNPCDDFYEYTCGNFKNIYPLDNATLTIDHFTLLEEKLTKIANQILSEDDFIDDPEALNKSKSAYKSCVDTTYLDKVTNPEKTIVEAENGFPLVQPTLLGSSFKYGFNDVGAAVSKYGIPMLFNLQAYTNLQDSNKNLIYIYPLDAIVPSEISEIRNILNKVSYEDFIEKGFSGLAEGHINKKRSSTLLPFDIFLRSMALKIRTAVQSPLTDDQVFSNLQAMVDFTRQVYRNGVVGNVTVDDFKNYTVTLNELNIWTKNQFNDTIELNWIEYIQQVYSNTGTEITGETEIMNYNGLAEFLYGIINLVRVTESQVVKSYVMMKIFTYLSTESDSESRQYISDYFKQQNYTILPRWKYCTRKIIDSVGTAGLSFAATYEYQLRHFSVNYYSQVVEMVENLQSSFKELMQNSSWMDTESKTKALEKLENIIVILAHPDISYSKEDLDKFYENLRICKWDNYGNSIRIKAFKNAYQISQVAKRERTIWDQSPFEVNAYYNRGNNKIIFPIAMLNPVFFGNQNTILDYARIGAIIGHEITHGFDQEGMKYGPDGTLQKWGTNETTKAFSDRASCFVDEYDEFYQPEIDAYVNGTTTLNENIADNGGARESFLAMKKMAEKRGITKGTAEFTQEQLFFVGFGTLWCNNPSLTYLEKMKSSDHSRSKFRVNGVVSNMAEFSKAFNCPVGSKMNPVNKCLLW